MRRVVRLCSLALTAFVAVGLSAALAQGGHRTFVELFTSQGCSSCPPADALLADLQHDPDFITLSLPVDYWDYIGWKDTLASPEFSKRQKAYAAARGDNHVYTPQVVVNGLVHVVGSNREGILAAAKASYGERGAMSVPLDVKMDGDMLRVDAGGAPEGGATWGGLWIMHVARARTVTIGRGENGGRTVTYTHVVRDISKIGEWGGRPQHYDIPQNELITPGTDGYVLVLQASNGGKLGPVLNAYSSLKTD